MCEEKIDNLGKSLQHAVEKQVEKAISDFKERKDRKCNLIVQNIPEPRSDSTDKKQEDEESLKKVFDVLKCANVRKKGFIRLGRPTPGKDRLMKV